MQRTLLALVFFVPSLAEADVPPPAGYVESCTVQLQTRPGKECRACSTYHGNPPLYCASQMAGGFEIVCRSRGSSAWTEVWCRDTSREHADTPPITAPPVLEPASPAPAPTEPAPAPEEPAPSPAPATAVVHTAPPPTPAATTSTGRDGCSSNIPVSDALLPLAMLALLFGRRVR